MEAVQRRRAVREPAEPLLEGADEDAPRDHGRDGEDARRDPPPGPVEGEGDCRQEDEDQRRPAGERGVAVVLREKAQRLGRGREHDDAARVEQERGARPTWLDDRTLWSQHACMVAG